MIHAFGLQNVRTEITLREPCLLRASGAVLRAKKAFSYELSVVAITLDAVRGHIQEIPPAA